MTEIKLLTYNHVSCPVSKFNVEQGVCVKCKNNLWGDFIDNPQHTEKISYCMN